LTSLPHLKRTPLYYIPDMKVVSSVVDIYKN
jgi:hypothetical protein